MGKSISNLYRYVGISKSITKRYIDALPDIDLEKPTLKEIKNVSEKIEVNNRTITGFNLLNNETLKLLQVISNGKYLINGFTNKSIRKEIFYESDSKSKYIINKTTRLLYKLKCHGIIKKVARKNKYYLTTNGRNLISSILVFTNRQLLN